MGVPALLPRAKLGPLIRRLLTSFDGEKIAAVAALERVLKSAGQSFHDLADAVEAEPVERVIWRDRPAAPTGEPETWSALARWIREHDRGRLSLKERQFIRDMGARLVFNGEPTDRQADWLRMIYAKLMREVGHG